MVKDVVDPVSDGKLAEFVVSSHMRAHPHNQVHFTSFVGVSGFAVIGNVLLVTAALGMGGVQDPGVFACKNDLCIFVAVPTYISQSMAYALT